MTILANPGCEPIPPGDTVELFCEFSSEPPAVTLQVWDPSGAKTEPKPTKREAKVWAYQFEPESSGRWYFKFDGDNVAATPKLTFVIE